MSTPSVRAYVGLGSNLDEPLTQLCRAYQAIGKLADAQVAGISNIYTTTPIGPVKQADFLNAVVGLDTYLDPHTLLAQLQGIETLQQRKRTLHWGPRTLDLDILLYGLQVIETDALQIPHPQLLNRAFVLIPLQDFVPVPQLPDGKLVPPITPPHPEVRLFMAAERFVETCRSLGD